MKKYSIYIFFALAMLQTSCSGIFEGLVVDLEIPEHEPVLTPYSFINASDSSIEVIVQQSQGALDNTDEAWINDATVELYKNGTLWNTITRATDLADGLYKMEMNEPFSIEGFGDTYELRVSAPNFETTTATQMMPSPIEPIEMEFVENGGTDLFGDLLNTVRITIDDPADEANYYMIDLAVSIVTTNANGDTVSLRQSWGGRSIGNNPSMAQGRTGLLLKDDLFDGQRYTFDVGTSASLFSSNNGGGSDLTEEGKVRVVLYSITRDEYLYQKSLATYAGSQGIFDEPTLIHTNMSQGLGAFTMMVSTIREFDF